MLNDVLEAIGAPVTTPIAGAVMTRSYVDMLVDNTIDNDKYFHCVGNCKAARTAGVCPTLAAATFREDLQDFIERHNGDRFEDEFANAIGRGGSALFGISCEKICARFLVRGINPRYQP